MKTELTPQEEALIPVVTREWIDFYTKPTTLEGVTKSVQWLYSKMELPMPKIVLVSSPQAMIEYCKKELGDEAPESLSYGNASDLGWVAFYDYFDRIGVEVTDEFREYREYARGGIYDAVAYEDIIVVSKYPTALHASDEGIPSCLTGPAFEWEDGYRAYYIKGRHIPTEWAEKCLQRTLTQEEYFSEKNDELRSAAFEYLGNDFAEFIGAHEVDSVSIVHGGGEVETISLIKTRKKANKIKNEPYAWIKRICPSTGTVYMTPTDPKFKTALEAAKFHRPEWVPMDLPYKWDARS